MSLEESCERLVRYVEDFRDEFRSKPPRVSWYHYLSEDMHAKKMIQEIVAGAVSLMPTVEDVAYQAGNSMTLKNLASKADDARPHRVTITGPDQQAVAHKWVKGVILIDVAMSARYTAGIRIMFG